MKKMSIILALLSLSTFASNLSAEKQILWAKALEKKLNVFDVTFTKTIILSPSLNSQKTVDLSFSAFLDDDRFYSTNFKCHGVAFENDDSVYFADLECEEVEPTIIDEL